MDISIKMTKLTGVRNYDTSRQEYNYQRSTKQPLPYNYEGKEYLKINLFIFIFILLLSNSND